MNGWDEMQKEKADEILYSAMLFVLIWLGGVIALFVIGIVLWELL